MPSHGTTRSESIHRQAFAHYLRTGQRLTNDEWIRQQERKFNPYHDEIGRFTSAPGTTVSWGRQGNAAHPGSRRRLSEPHPAPKRSSPRKPAKSPTFGEMPTPQRQSSNPPPRSAEPGFRSDFVRNAVSPQTSYANSVFDLNRR